MDTPEIGGLPSDLGLLSALLGPQPQAASKEQLIAIVEQLDTNFPDSIGIVLTNVGAGASVVDVMTWENDPESEYPIPRKLGAFYVSYDGNVYEESEDGFKAAIEDSKQSVGLLNTTAAVVA